MSKQWDPSVSYAKFAVCAVAGGLVASAVTGSILPVVVVAAGLAALFAFFTGISQPRRGSAKLRS